MFYSKNTFSTFASKFCKACKRYLCSLSYGYGRQTLVGKFELFFFFFLRRNIILQTWNEMLKVEKGDNFFHIIDFCVSYSFTSIKILQLNIDALSLIYDKQLWQYMSHVMRKTVYAICEQQRYRSAWASAQSDQPFIVPCLDSIIPLVSLSKIASL